MKNQRTETVFLWLPLLLVPVLLVLGCCAGAYWISPLELCSSGEANTAVDPVVDLRLIRMLAALTVGGSLALSGMVFQAVLRNPLAEPFILGVSGGAGVGAALVIVCGLSAWSVLSLPLGALAGALLALGIVLGISRRGSGRDNLLLSGVIVGTIAGSVLKLNNAVKNVLDHTDLPVHEVFNMASLNPAAAIHAADRLGSLEEGKDADIIIADENIQILRTIKGGKTIYEA